MKSILYILCFATILVLSACKNMPSEVNILEGDNRHWRTIYSSEENYYKKSRNLSRPQIGLALSGGGQRSASVSIGFLESLYRSGILDDVDVISSVSGGSYAAYWWYTKHYWAETRNEIFRVVDKKGRYPEIFRRFNTYTGSDDEEKFCVETESNAIPSCRPSDSQITVYEQFPFFLHNFNNGYLLNRSQKTGWIRKLELAGKLIGFIPTIPIHWLVNGVFDMKLNFNPFHLYYRNGIERDYGLYPIKCNGKDDCEPLKTYANATDFIFPRTGADDPSAEKLLQAMETERLPFWVINATAAYGTKPVPKLLRGEWSGYSNDLRHTVYEFTPLYQGSPWWGFCGPDVKECKTDFIGLSRQVAISGAAIDSLPYGGNIAIDIFNISLGQYIDNPKVSDDSRFIHRAIPSPLAWLHHGEHDTKAPFIYLSDGGHSDNLGLYSLVRRDVKKIVVLDAEQESNDGYQAYASFDSLQSTRIHLWKEHGLLVDLPEIFGDFPVMDAPISAETLHFDYLKSSSPIFKGVICKATPGKAHCPTNDPKNQDLWYVKLAVEKTKFPTDKKKFYSSPFDACLKSGKIDNYPYSCLTLKYGMDQFSESDTFPHNSTGDIFYSPTQYSGYVSLGTDLGCQFIKEWAKSYMQNTKLDGFCKPVQRPDGDPKPSPD